MADKRISVTMHEDFAAILKEYCSFFKISQSDALNLFTKAAIQSHSLHCRKVASIFELRQKNLDKRAGKPCFGFACLSCAHATKCCTGLYEGFFEVGETYKHLILKSGFMPELLELHKKYNPEE